MVDLQAKTALTTIDGNVMFNGPRAGINYNDGFGGGDVISNNLVFSTCRESGDHGPFNVRRARGGCGVLGRRVLGYSIAPFRF